MSQNSYTQDNTGSLLAQYPTPDSTQPQINNFQSRTPSTQQNSQSNTTQIADSFLSDVPQGIYSECSTLDNSLSIPIIQQDSSDLTPHTPESLLYSPAPDASLGDDLNSRKQLRRSPRNLNNRSLQTSEQQSDSTALRSQESSNNRELIIKNPAALALEVLNEPTDFSLIQQIIEEKNNLVSKNLDKRRLEIDTENRDINELRDLITTSNMILDSVHHNSASHNQLKDTECTFEQHKSTTSNNKSFTPRSELEREHEHENEYPESVELVFSNEISDTLLRQSEHYNNMASKFSNLKFIKVKPDSDEETDQFTTPTSELRRSSRKRTTANYSYPRYSYGSGSNKRSKTRKRSRSFRKGSLPVISRVSNVNNKKNNEPVHELSPIQSDDDMEINDDAHDIQYADDVEDVDNDNNSNLYLKHDLRSRKIMLELLEGTAKHESEEESEEEPVEEPVEEPIATVSSRKTRSSNQPAKKSAPKEKSILKEKSAPKEKSIPKEKSAPKEKSTPKEKSIPKEKSTPKSTPKEKSAPKGKSAKTIKRRSTSRRKIEDTEWHPDKEVDDESDDAVESPTTSTPRGRRATLKTRSASKSPTAPKKTIVRETTPETSTTKKSSSKKATPKTPRTPKVSRMVRKPTRGRGISRGGPRLKNHDDEYKYSAGEETESEIEINEDIVNDNSENQIAQESSDIEMDSIQENVAVVEEQVSTPTRPKRTRKSTKSPISESVISTPKYTRSTRSRGGSKRGGRKGVDVQFDDDMVKDNNVVSVHELSEEEEDEVNTPEVQEFDLIPKKSTRGTQGGARGGKGRGRGGRVSDNVATDQPSVPTSDPDVVEVSAGNPTALANAVRVLAGQNYDIVQTDENIVDIASIEETRAPVFVKPHSPATHSTSLSGTPPPESHTSDWSQDHWHHLKIFYEETKSEYISSGKFVNGNEDVYKEVTKRFFEADINNRTFGEEHLRMRIIALESAKAEKNSDLLDNIQRRSSIESDSSRGSVSHYNKAYSNLRDNIIGTKRKRSESNATIPENKKDYKNDENDETEDNASKRPRVEETEPSESGSIPATSAPHENGMLSKLFGGWFGRSQSNPALLDEETQSENENIMVDDESSDTTPTRSRSWLW